MILVYRMGRWCQVLFLFFVSGSSHPQVAGKFLPLVIIHPTVMVSPGAFLFSRGGLLIAVTAGLFPSGTGGLFFSIKPARLFSVLANLSTLA